MADTNQTPISLRFLKHILTWLGWDSRQPIRRVSGPFLKAHCQLSNLLQPLLRVCALAAATPCTLLSLSESAQHLLEQAHHRM